MGSVQGLESCMYVCMYISGSKRFSTLADIQTPLLLIFPLAFIQVSFVHGLLYSFHPVFLPSSSCSLLFRHPLQCYFGQSFFCYSLNMAIPCELVLFNLFYDCLDQNHLEYKNTLCRQIADIVGFSWRYIIIIIIIIIFINCNWVVIRWQWLFYMYTNVKKEVTLNLSREGYMRSMQQRLGGLETISAFACRHRETNKNLCRGGRSQDLPDTDFQPAVRHLK